MEEKRYILKIGKQSLQGLDRKYLKVTVSLIVLILDFILFVILRDSAYILSEQKFNFNQKPHGPIHIITRKD